MRWAHITAIFDMWVKVRNLLMNVPNAAENRGRCLTSAGRRRSCYWSVLKKTIAVTMKFLKTSKHTFLYILVDTHSRLLNVHAVTSAPTWKNKVLSQVSMSPFSYGLIGKCCFFSFYPSFCINICGGGGFWTRGNYHFESCLQKIKLLKRGFEVKNGL